MAIDTRIVSSNISKLRNNRGMTQFQLAAALNVSHQAVSKWETGAALPDIQTLLALTQLFGVTMEELLNTEIVIREEAEQEECGESAPEESIFPGFLNDLIPEEAKKALKNAAGEVKKTFIEVSENLSAQAGKTFESAARFAEKAKNDIEGCFKEATSSRKEADKKEEEAKEEEVRGEDPQQKPNIGLKNLIRMAPFMSREKLSELVLRYADDADIETIVQLAPFLNRATIQKLIEKKSDACVDNQTLRRLAPFASADTLYQLVLNNLDEFDWKTLESIVPFLKRHMVDALAEYAITGVKPEPAKQSAETETKGAKDTIREALEGVMGMVNEIGSVAKSIFTPDQAEENESGDPDEEEDAACEPAYEEEEEEFIPATEETEEFVPVTDEAEDGLPEEAPAQEADDPENESAIDAVARHALETGNWSWIRDHAHDIKDDQLSAEIAEAAVSAVANTDSAAIVMKLICRMSEESKARVYKKVADESAWELAVALQSYASEENAKIIIEKAAEAEGFDREDAYLAIECYAKLAPKDVIASLTAEAIESDNWVLINALTDVM